MSKKSCIKPLAAALGAAMATSLVAAPNASAADNPFAMNELPGGYMVADKEGKCGEGKCGGAKKSAEGKCGGEKGMDKKMEGKCGGEKGMDKEKEGKCGGKK